MVGETPEEYASLVALLLRNPDLCQTIGKAGRSYVQSEFSWRSSSNELLGIMLAQSEEMVVNSPKLPHD